MKALTCARCGEPLRETPLNVPDYLKRKWELVRETLSEKEEEERF